MDKLKKSLKHALTIVLAGVMLLSEIPVSAVEFSKEESSVEISGDALLEETAESPEIEREALESEETEAKDTVPESEETELKNTVQTSETAVKKESITFTKDEETTTIEKEDDYTTSELMQTEEDTSASEEETVQWEKTGDTYDPMEVDAEPVTFSAPVGDIVYDAEEGADYTKTKYNLEGYAASANVTGGGLLREDSPCYHKVSNELEFIQTLSSLAGVRDKPHVIEITADLNLGDLELNEKYKDDKLNVTKKGDGYKNLIRAAIAEPLMHPTLKKTGVSYIKLYDFHNLTIFSKNGATIKHTSIRMGGGSGNIIVRNLAFDELWEWDEATSGEYDRNDWDYITINDNAEGIWIDHCTFYRAYDGVIDIKNLAENPIDYQRVTISWCEVLPGSKDNLFFNEQMTWLEEHIDETTYYKQLRNEYKRAPNANQKMSAKDVWYVAYGQKKTHLLGCDDSNTQDKAIRVTFANNYYKNSRSRLPMLRCGKVHEYNSIFDSQELHTQHLSGTPHISGIGAICVCKGEMLLENCYISGLRQPLKTAPGAREGYVNAVDCLYYMNGSPAEIKIAVEGTLSPEKQPIPTDAVRFKENLIYKDYTKYDASKLKELVLPYVGAGKLTMTTVQWERTSYNGEEKGGEDESSSTETSGTDESESVPEEGLYIVGLREAYDYTGAKIIPDIEVWDYDIPGGKRLKLGIDYTVTYKNNLNSGTNTAEVIVTGKGNYSGKDITRRFTIQKVTDVTENFADLKGARINKIAAVPYTGDAVYPDFTLLLKDGSSIKYIQNTDANNKGLYKRDDGKPMNVNVAVSNNVNKGTATILVSGAADARGKVKSVKKTFPITAVDLAANADKVTVDKPEAVEYAVSGAIPETLIVKYDGKTLKSGKDYTVKYARNKKAGTGTVTITGKGNYAKKYPKTVEYTITPLDLSGLRVDAVTVYDGVKAGRVKATVRDRNKTALKASQYTVKLYKKAEGDEVYNAADSLVKGMPVYVAVEAKDTVNLKAGTATPRALFTVGKDISKAKFVVKKDAVKFYTGNAVTLGENDLKVTMKGEPEELKMGKDYDAVYTNNVNKGTATAVIRGIGEYSGTKIVKFKIVGKKMTINGVKSWESLSKQIVNAMKKLSNE